MYHDQLDWTNQVAVKENLRLRDFIISKRSKIEHFIKGNDLFISKNDICLYYDPTRSDQSVGGKTEKKTKKITKKVKKKHLKNQNFASMQERALSKIADIHFESSMGSSMANSGIN